MKKVIILLAVLCLVLAGCAGPEKTNRALQDIYAEMEKTQVLPPMIQVDKDLALDFYGIDVSECTEYVMQMSSDSMLADEVILLRAKDQKTADELKALLDSRMEDKAAEAKGYSPEQYAIIQKGKVLQNGNDLALIVSPDVDKLTEIYNK